MCRSTQPPLERIKAALDEMPGWLASRPSGAMGEVVIDARQVIDRMEAVSAEATRRFERSGGYKADGALGIVPWLRDKAKLTGVSAAEHVEVARQLDQLPRTDEALQRGEIGYQHAVAMARTAEHVGTAAVRKAEATLLKAAESMDPGQFVGVAKDFEHRVDAEAALTESNRANARRYLTIGEPINGLARIDGQLIPEAAATIRSAMERFMKPSGDDDRTPGQRAHDALVEVCRRSGALRPDGRQTEGSSPRP